MCTLHNAIMLKYITAFSFCSHSSHIPRLSSTPSGPSLLRITLIRVSVQIYNRDWVSALNVSAFWDARCPLLAVASNDVRASLAQLHSWKQKIRRSGEPNGAVILLDCEHAQGQEGSLLLLTSAWSLVMKIGGETWRCSASRRNEVLQSGKMRRLFFSCLFFYIWGGGGGGGF